MESLESRELLSINPLGYDGSYDNSDTVQTSQTFAGESDFSTEAAVSDLASTAKTDTTVTLEFTSGSAEGAYQVMMSTDGSNWSNAAGTSTSGGKTVGKISGIVVSGLTANTAYQFKVVVSGATTDTSENDDSNVVNVTTSAAAPAPTAVTNSVGTTSGLTTDAVTITWTKPTVYTGGTNDVALKGAGNYELVITNKNDSSDTITVDAATLKTKTSWAATGLTAGATYTFTVSTDKLTAKDGTAISGSSTFVVATGEFTALAEGDAAKVTVGHPTDLKTAWTDKDKTVKVTWKAPANYTGAYTVKFTKGTDSFTIDVPAGAKLELIVKTGTSFSNATDLELLAVDTFYDVEIAAGTTAATDTTNGITSKTICYTGKTAPAVNDVGDPALPAAAVAGAQGSRAGVVKVTIGHASSGGTPDGAVGYYVGYAASATPTAPTDFSKFVYVTKASGAGITETVLELVGQEQFLVVYAVAADGSTSTVTASSAELEAAAYGATLQATENYEAAPANNGTYTMIGTNGQGATIKATADATTKTTVKITGITVPTAGVPVGTGATTAKPADDGDTLLKGKNILISYSKDGGTTWIAGPSVAATATEATVSGLDWGTAYQFKVEVTYETYTVNDTDPNNLAWNTTADATGVQWGKAVTVNLTTAAAPKVATPAKAATPVDLNTGTTATVQWTSVAGTNYQVKLIDANKAVLATDTITDGSGKWAITGLIPKGKYTVEVVALGTIPGTVSAPLKISVTAAEFLAPTIKDAKASTITDIKVTVTKNAKATGDQFYYVEYTSVTDAKGKPDWSAANVVDNSSGASGVPTGAAGDYTISKLNPGTQYFVRVVTTDKAYSGASGGQWSEMTKSVASKEVKIKTLAVPMATISKPGFAVNGTDFGVKMGVLAPSAAVKAGKLELMDAADTFTYELFVADASAKADKVTGALVGAERVASWTNSDILETKDAKGKVIATPSPFVKFGDIAALLPSIGTMKSVQFQLKVTYTNAAYNNGATDGTEKVYCTNYTKAAKLTMPKWYV